MEFGFSTAAVLGWINEYIPGGGTPESRCIDLWNNRVGREKSKNLKSRKSLFLKIKEAIKLNELILTPNDPRCNEVKKWKSPLLASGRLVVLTESKNGLNESYLDV